jgi:hypothetical protein
MAKYSGSTGTETWGLEATITAATGTSSVAVTAAGHDFAVLDTVLIEDVVGMTDLNGYHQITAANATLGTFSVPVTPPTAQSYSSGGKAARCMSITNFDLKISSEPVDVTDNMSGSDNEFIPSGINSFEASQEGFVVHTEKRPTVGSSTTVRYKVGKTKFSGTAIVQSSDVNVEVAGKGVKISETLKGTGSIVETPET